MNGEANHAAVRGGMLQAQCIAGAYRVQEFDGRYPPIPKIDAARALDDLQRLVEQHGTGQHRKLRKVTGERGVVPRDFQAVHACGRRLGRAMGREAQAGHSRRA